MEQQRTPADRWRLVAIVVTAFVTSALIDQLTDAPWFIRLLGAAAAALAVSYGVTQWLRRRALPQQAGR